jgi:hypothetical protein
MANYGYEHIAEEASRYLDVYDAFRAEGAFPRHKLESNRSIATPVVWIEVDEIEEAPLP